MLNVELNTSWLHGTHTYATINTSLPSVMINNYSEGESFFAQGEEADSIINEIHEIWMEGIMTADEAIKQYINQFGN